MSDSEYKLGDIVNGHILGADYQWHPLDEDITSSPTSPTQQPIQQSAQQPVSYSKSSDIFVGLGVHQSAQLAFKNKLMPHFYDVVTKQEYRSTQPPPGFIVTHQIIEDNKANLYGSPKGYVQPEQPAAQPVSYPQGYALPQTLQQQTQQQTSLPLLALIFGIGGFFFSLLCSVPAIILGIMGRKKAKELSQPISMATAGLVLGIIGTVLSLLIIVLIAVPIGLAQSQSDKAKSATARYNIITIAKVIQTGVVDGNTVTSDGTTVSYVDSTGRQSVDLGTATINKKTITQKTPWCVQDSGGGETWHMTQDGTSPLMGACRR